jgi:hypothetical protein
VSDVAVVVCAVPLAVVLALAALLARSAVSSWARERTGRAYELPADYRPAARRAIACVVVLGIGGVMIALGVPVARVRYDPAPPDAQTAAQGAAAAPHAAGTHGTRRRTPPRRTKPPRHTAAPSANAADRPAPREIAEPAGGSLRELADGTRVWLPPQYAYPTAAALAFPVVVAYLPRVPAEQEELYPAFVRHVELGKADPFVVVEPSGCGADPAAAADEAARHYRLLTGASARGLVGVGTSASCAVRAALAHPDAFGAYVAVSGTYEPDGLRLPAALPTPLHLLLTASYGEPSRRLAAYRLRAALRPLGTEARIIDALHADPLIGGTARRHELADAAQYLTEQLRGPSRTPAR